MSCYHLVPCTASINAMVFDYNNMYLFTSIASKWNDFENQKSLKIKNPQSDSKNNLGAAILLTVKNDNSLWNPRRLDEFQLKS